MIPAYMTKEYLKRAKAAITAARNSFWTTLGDHWMLAVAACMFAVFATSLYRGMFQNEDSPGI